MRSPCHPDWLCDGGRGRTLVGGRLGAKATGYIVPPSTLSDKAQGLHSRAGLPLLATCKKMPGEERQTDCGAICERVPVENRQTDR